MPYAVENPMVVDSLWDVAFADAPCREKLRGPGYEDMETGTFVPEADAYKYAMEMISVDEDLKREFVEWFYSGNWIKED